MSDRDDHGGGRGKPPRHSQFGKGRSGNLEGRPKGSKNAAKAYQALLFESVRLRSNGRRSNVTRFEVMLMVTIRKAHEGHARAKRNLDQLRDACIGVEQDEAPEGGVLRLSKQDYEDNRRLASYRGIWQGDESDDL